MTKKIIPQIKKIYQQTNFPILIVFVVFAFILWYFNKLNHTFVTTVTLPVRIENSADNTFGVLNPVHDVECRIEGLGYRLMAYKFFPERNAVNVNIRRIDLQPTDDAGVSEVTPSSLFNAMSEQLTDVKLLGVLTPRFELHTSQFRTRKLPVKSRITVDFRNQYMQIGPTVLIPDSIEVKSLGIFVDTMQAVYTEYRHFPNVNGTLTGRIPIDENPEVIYTEDEVTYTITIEEYTEADLKLPIEIENIPAGYRGVVLPGEVIVRLNVSHSNYTGSSLHEIRAYVDYNDRRTNIGNDFKVYIDHGLGVEVKSLSSIYAEILIEQQDD